MVSVPRQGQCESTRPSQVKVQMQRKFHVWPVGVLRSGPIWRLAGGPLCRAMARVAFSENPARVRGDWFLPGPPNVGGGESGPRYSVSESSGCPLGPVLWGKV